VTERAPSEYGAAGHIGVGTPQANPTVEAEFGILLPRACSLHVARMTSGAAEPEQRLRDYLDRLDDWLATYDELRPDVFGFACTGSSYLAGPEAERRITDEAARRRGYPVETAARAIVWGLERLGVRRIALVAPYPPAIVEAARRYWSAAGIEVLHTARVVTRGADTRTIYELTGDRVAEAIAGLRRDGAEALLLSGTGMPSLAALAGSSAGMPAISSNSCLAARLLDLIGGQDWLEPGEPAIRGWRQRYDEARCITPPAPEPARR
jgi:maleate isomerase